MDITHFSIKAPVRLTIALVSDLHDESIQPVLNALDHEQIDIIAVAGDLSDSLGKLAERERQKKRINRKAALQTLEALAARAPTYYSLGNHEFRVKQTDLEDICKTGVKLLDNTWTDCQFPGEGREQMQEVHIGGLTSALVMCQRLWQAESREVFQLMRSTREMVLPDTSFLNQFSSQKGYKILLCHHPEYFPVYLQHQDIDLILCGHAHGGQIRLFGKGLFAPGQGIFPKYTAGVHENRMVISRGLANTAGYIPRIGNARELVIVHLAP